jgi:CheY-like chemotaxis protein/HPt (histidine-containing phosphotransfer) domain-containing protein
VSNPPEIPALLDDKALGDLHEDFASTGDLGELATLIHNFCTRSERDVEAVRTAVAAGDAEGVRTSGHKLKGSSQTLGASLLGAVAAKVESAGAEGDLATAQRAARELEIAYSLTRGALTDMADAIGGSPLPAGPVEGATSAGGLHALLADDEPVALAVLRATVERLGHSSTAVTDGEAALAAFERERPQVVITDLQMPGLDGLTLAGRIRALDGPSPYIAVLSASGERGAGALGDTVDAVLSKPAREDELQAVLGLAAQRAS